MPFCLSVCLPAFLRAVLISQKPSKVSFLQTILTTQKTAIGYLVRRRQPAACLRTYLIGRQLKMSRLRYLSTGTFPPFVRQFVRMSQLVVSNKSHKERIGKGADTYTRHGNQFSSFFFKNKDIMYPWVPPPLLYEE